MRIEYNSGEDKTVYIPMSYVPLAGQKGCLYRYLGSAVKTQILKQKCRTVGN